MLHNLNRNLRKGTITALTSTSVQLFCFFNLDMKKTSYIVAINVGFGVLGQLIQGQILQSTKAYWAMVNSLTVLVFASMTAFVLLIIYEAPFMYIMVMSGLVGLIAQGSDAVDTDFANELASDVPENYSSFFLPVVNRVLLIILTTAVSVGLDAAKAKEKEGGPPVKETARHILLVFPAICLFALIPGLLINDQKIDDD